MYQEKKTKCKIWSTLTNLLKCFYVRSPFYLQVSHQIRRFHEDLLLNVSDHFDFFWFITSKPSDKSINCFRNMYSFNYLWRMKNEDQNIYRGRVSPKKIKINKIYLSQSPFEIFFFCFLDRNSLKLETKLYVRLLCF